MSAATADVFMTTKVNAMRAARSTKSRICCLLQARVVRNRCAGNDGRGGPAAATHGRPRATRVEPGTVAGQTIEHALGHERCRYQQVVLSASDARGDQSQ